MHVYINGKNTTNANSGEDERNRNVTQSARNEEKDCGRVSAKAAYSA